MPESAHSSLPQSSSELSPDFVLRPQRKPQRKPPKPRLKAKPRSGTHLVITDSEDHSDGNGASDDDIPDTLVIGPSQTTSTFAPSGLSGHQSPDDDGSWFAIKDIIGEKTKGRRLFYLVDWADHAETGASYPPSWIPAKDASAVAVRDWKAKKKKQAEQSTKQPKKSTRNTQSSSYVDSSSSGNKSASGKNQVSQSTEAYQTPSPTIPRKRSYSLSDDYTDSLLQSADGADSTNRSRPPVLSSPPISREAGTDSAEHNLVFLASSVLSSLRGQEISIELNQGSDFDPNEYERFSQLSYQSQTRLPQLASSRSVHSGAPTTQSQNEASPASKPFSASPFPESYSGPVIADSQSEATGSLNVREAAHHSKRQRTTGNASVDGSGSESVRFLTQLEPGFDFSTQRDSPASVVQTPDLPSDRCSTHCSVVPDFTRPERTAAAKNDSAPASLSSSSVSAAAVATVPDSVPSAQVVEQLPSNSQDLLLTQQPSLTAQTQHTDSDVATLPRSSTPSQSSSVLNMDSDAMPSAVNLLRQAQRDALGPDGFDSMEDDPLVLAEIQRMGEESRSSQENSTGASGVAAPSASLVPEVPNPSPFLPPSNSSTPLALAADKRPQPNAMALDARLQEAAGTSLFVSPGLNQLVDLEPVSTERPVDKNVAPTTIAPSDLFSAPHLATDGLELSPEPEDFVAEEASPITHDLLPVPRGHDSEGDAAESPVSMADKDDGDNVDNDDNGDHEGDNDDDDDADSEGQAVSNPNLTTRDYVVTLPLAANLRQRYIDLVMEPKNKKTIQAFGAVFSDGAAKAPEAELVGRVDELLRKLLDLADLPPFYDNLPSLSDEAKTKHATNTSCKFSFVYELLEAIGTCDKKVLILAQKDTALGYLQALLRSVRIPFQLIRGATAPAELEINTDGDGGDGGDEDKAEGTSGCSLSVVLADTEVKASALPRDIDIVIGFDHTARSSGLLANFLDAPVEAAAADNGVAALPKPMVLLLVAAFTLEHIDLRLELDTVDDLERKNALLLCTLECLTYLQDLVLDDTPGKPHEAADAFGKIITDPTQPLTWTPTVLPEDVFDIYVHAPNGQRVTFSQQESLGESVIASKKRQLDDNRVTSTAKRARMNEAVTPIVPKQSGRLSNTIKQALGGDGRLLTGGPTVQISLAQLEDLAAKVMARGTQAHGKERIEKALAERVRSLEKLVKESTATVNECQRRLFETVKERGVFEVERDKAIKEAETTRQTLVSRDATVAELKAKNKQLEEQLAEAHGLLASSAQPDLQRLGAAMSEAGAATAQKQQLEKKLRNAETDLEHARRAYQDASNAISDFSADNQDLTVRVKELEQRAGTNLREIHEMHQRSEAAAYRRQWEEMRSALGERERELERARDELRVLKTGRRETRGQSVPRSPRLGVLSPRMVVTSSGRGVGSAMSLPPASGAGHRSSASRGNSPVSVNFDPTSYSTTMLGDGMAFLTPQQGGGRWGHLRD